MRQERAELTRHALTMAAARSFDRSGYQRTTLFEVSRGAAMSKGALSFHFGSKEELADTVRREACIRTYQAAQVLRDKDQPPLQTLIDLTHLVAHQLAHDHLSRAAVKLARELETPPDPEINPLVCWRQIFTDVAREAEKDGMLRGEATAEAVAELAFCLASGAYSEQTDQTSDVHQRLAGHWQLLLNGLVPVEEHLWIAGTEADWLHVTSREPALGAAR
ncbi:TetR/AcrR family transcriptional regulator [Streptomyces albidus (ex Kaewkla and Franco 2022)]|uniref:TetR/AcrR family transcriptional regulator n=1 Tax=Streptomyces albidus (ex Kaewkla and Franco 2022) TaxID=722709 RepID=UPI0015EF82B4|nr:TetR/AcrR family transcriptional regulator [Streptomyces albidus (ex Kaewkla and Franco 2022)]